jgi:salicylate hydroxylase
MNHETLPTKRLRAAIVGGGIGGLSAACSLRRRGVDVMVFEQSEALGEIGAGLTIFPNSLRQLERMGLGEALAAVGARIGDGSQWSDQSSRPIRAAGMASTACTGLTC